MRRRFDLVAFIFGMIMIAVAVVAMWMALAGPIPFAWLKVAAPLFLVLVGVVGLTISRNRKVER